MSSQLTKRALEESLKRLLLQKPLNKITIADITDDCGISRPTFYYHFQDIYDLVEWACEEDAERAIAGNKTATTWQVGLLNLLHAVRENRPFIMNVYRCVSREQVERYLFPVTHNLIMGVAAEEVPPARLHSADLDFIANFFSYAFVGVVLEWIRGDMREAPELIVERISTLMKGQIEQASERLARR